LIADAAPTAFHIATEGPSVCWCGDIAAARTALHHQISHPFLLGIHLRRLADPESWIWAALRRFHGASQAVMAATPRWPANCGPAAFATSCYGARRRHRQFHPRVADLGPATPVFLCVGRVAVEKNLEAFLELDCPVPR